jgi:endonuclease YncB( thermonuclease family)
MINFVKKNFRNFLTIIFLAVFFITFYEIFSDQKKISKEELIIKNNQTNKNFNYQFSGFASAIDGDSLRIGNKEIRLIEIDAAEYSQNCFDKNHQEYQCGKDSHNFLKNFIKGKKVVCKYNEFDFYNRYLAECFIENKSINKTLLEKGMAVIFNISAASNEIIEIENQAKQKRIGIWQGAFQLPKDYRKTKKFKNEKN